MWETMGPIADRALDKLGASDLAIVEFRNRWSKLHKTSRKTVRSSGALTHVPQRFLRSFEGVVRKTTDGERPA